MLAYAGFLLLCGVVAFAGSGFSVERGLTALIVPGACAAVMAVCAALAARYASNRTVGMIGIHLGLGFPLLFAAAVGWRAVLAWQSQASPETAKPLALAIVLTVVALGSVVAFVAILRTRPPASARQAPLGAG